VDPVVKAVIASQVDPVVKVVQRAFDDLVDVDVLDDIG